MFSYRKSPLAVWPFVLLALGMASNSVFGCGADLIAISVLAGCTLSKRLAFSVSIAVWLESQILGFAFYAFPHDGTAIGWGVAMGMATLLATATAARSRRNVVMGFATSGFVYMATLFCFAVIGALGFAMFTPTIVGEIFIANASVTAVLYGLRHILNAWEAKRAFALRIP